MHTNSHVNRLLDNGNELLPFEGNFTGALCNAKEIRKALSRKSSFKDNASEVPLNDQGGGILWCLSLTYNGKISKTGVVEATASTTKSGDLRSTIRNQKCAYWRLGDQFESQNSPDQWVCFDFKERQVLVSAYMVGSISLQSWVLEGSSDGASCREIDRQNGRKTSNRSPSSFRVEASDKIFRMVRLLQVGKNSSGSEVLQIGFFELFGSITRLGSLKEFNNCGVISGLGLSIERGTLDITSRYIWDDYGPENAIKAPDDLYCWDYGLNNWLCFDFKDRKVIPTAYCLTEGSDPASYHMRSWSLEGSNDHWDWTEIDRHEDSDELTYDDQWVDAGFDVECHEAYRFLRLRFLDDWDNAGEYLCGFDVFGRVIEGCDYVQMLCGGQVLRFSGGVVGTDRPFSRAF